MAMTHVNVVRILLCIMCVIFKGVHDNAGHLEVGKNIAFGQGLFTLTTMA